jgi:glutamine cyclotransferase
MELTVPRRRLAVLFLPIALAQLLLGQSSHQTLSTRPPEYTFKVVQAFPHDTTAFTQGLAYRDGFLNVETPVPG